MWRTGSLVGLLLLLLSLTTPFAASPPPPAVAAPIAGAATRIGEGVYTVYATREGLVGGFTSSGHKIVDHDYFVSLPSCTTTSCPRGAVRGNMTDCGARCYVKVVNPRTNACRVEPVYDTGPWFRVDDWWNPTARRYLNSLPTNPSDLAQGYTGSEAARRGLDVGYGIGPKGFGYDDTGTTPPRPMREVGNRSAIDLADGTWYDLRLTSDGTGADVTVHMLWQTGADPAAQARACGHPLNQKPPLYPPGTPNPSFRGFKANITNSFDNPVTGTAPGAHDANPNTIWFSGRDAQPRAALTVDLGTTYDLSGVKWKFHTLGLADQFSVSVTNETGGTRGLGIFSNPPSPQTFHGVATSDPVHARFVTLTFENPNRDASLGSISELEVWVRSLAPPRPGETTPGALNPSFPGFKAGIVYSGDRPYTGTSFAAYDNNLGTTWFSGRDYQPQAALTVDLGATYDLTGIRWKFHTLGLADRFTVAAVNDAGQSRTLGLFGNASYPQAFYGVGISDPVYARYVVFGFTNIGNDASLGSISELEVWATRYVPASAISSAALEATLTPPITRSPSPTVTPGPTLTATPFPTITPTVLQTITPSSTATTIPLPTATTIPSPTTMPTMPPTTTTNPTLTPTMTPTPSPTLTPAPTPDATPAATDAVDVSTPTPEVAVPTTPAETGTPEPTVASNKVPRIAFIAFTGGDGAFCRELPDADGPVIALVPEGAEVTLVGEPSDGWQPVTCDGQPGYVRSEFLIEDAPLPPESLIPPEPTATSSDATVPVDPSSAGTPDPIEARLAAWAPGDVQKRAPG